MIRKWPKTSSKKLADYRIFSVRTDQKQSPRTGKEHDFFVIESVNWVNVIPVTADGRLVMIEQYRHGSDSIELEVPGGMMDPQDGSPIEAGLRELREETGYEGEGAREIGVIYPNPAIMSNVCHTVLVQNCVCRHPTAFDHNEDIVTRLVAISDLPRLIRERVIMHSLVVVALYHFDLWQRDNPSPK